MTTCHLLGLLLVAIGKRVALYGMRLACIEVDVLVQRAAYGMPTPNCGSATPDMYSATWTSAHEQPRINTVPPKGWQ